MNDTIFFFLQDNWFPGLLVLALAVVLLRLVLIGRRGRMWRDLGKDTAKAAVATSLAAGALAIPEIVVPPPAAALEDLSAPVTPGAGGRDGDDGPGPA